MWFECCCTALRENVGWQCAVRLTHRHGLFLPALSSKFLLKEVRLACSKKEEATVVVRNW